MVILILMLIYILPSSAIVNLTYYVGEDKSPGFLIGNIQDDINSIEPSFIHNQGSKGLIWLQQFGTKDSSKLFRVSKRSGKLYTAKKLDAEALCVYNTECFQMMDIAVYRKEALLKVLEIKVFIQDVNDNQPEFPTEQVSIEFSEDSIVGARRWIPNAFDKDVGYLNSKLRYSLRTINHEPFSLFISEGSDRTAHLSLTLQDKLDRENRDSYFVRVIAKDRGSPPLQDNLVVHISVVDVNDNSPIFLQKIYNISVDNEPSDVNPIAAVYARDSDYGKNGEIVYRLMSKTLKSAKSFFRVDKENGKIFLKKRVPEKEAKVYKLYVEARDKGSPSLSAVTKVVISLVSQRNHAPVIEVRFVMAAIGNMVKIPEDTKISSFIAYVTARDQDIGQNGRVTCDINHDLFRLENIGTKKYKVILKSSLDRETRASHNISVTCQDSGLPPLKSRSNFTIQVVDVNDVKPQFSQEKFEFWVHENQNSDFPVGFINASDTDLGSSKELIYTLLTDGREILPFQISEKGFISTTGTLDRETKEKFEFKVIVKDRGSPSLNNTVNVIVKVRDENDNAPYFTFPSVNPYNMDVIYYPHHTKNISQIKASDSDSQENAFLKYEIIRGNSKQIFTINQYTGLLCSTHVLSQQDAGSYELEFLVKDSGSPVLSARTTVYLTLTISNTTMSDIKDSSDGLELHIVISVVVTTMTISVVFSVVLLMCFMQYYEVSNNVIKKRNQCPGKLVSEQRQLETSCYSVCPQDATSETQTMESLKRDDNSTELKELSRRIPEDNWKKSGSFPRRQKSMVDISKISFAKSDLTPVGEIQELNAVEDPDHFTLNPKSSSSLSEKEFGNRSEKYRILDRWRKGLYSRSFCADENSEPETVRMHKLQDFINEHEGNIITNQPNSTFHETLPTRGHIYTHSMCSSSSSRPLSIASLYQLSQSLDNENTLKGRQLRSLPITRL